MLLTKLMNTAGVADYVIFTDIVRCVRKVLIQRTSEIIKDRPRC